MSFVVIAAKDKIPLLPWANVLHTHPQDRDDSPTKCRMVRNTKVRRLSNRMHLHTRDTVIICMYVQSLDSARFTTKVGILKPVPIATPIPKLLQI